MKKLFKLLTLSIVVVIVGCSSGTDIESDLGLENAPDWVNEGSKAIDNDDGRLVQGVGSAPKMGDLSLQKSTADNRARAEIARIMSTFMDATMSDYSASNGEEFDMQVQQVIKSSTQIALNGSKIMGNWRDPETGILFSFAELDMSKLKEAVANADIMNKSFQKYFDDEFDANFDRFMKKEQN
ncbi:LPP20 family lipoprotein [Thalassotalea agarivorans]|uniref:LPP20 lipoprotein n=1 Tax=Thalassotalea agarivorans TaxID=349064 RepID=A0A1H9Y5U4_THASX|nr:LPP20 family lipoprotein [Thalassotalea agarivorans]SES64088.1 hypothetical protein SAMN05660429_00083 [Thalassotalea agarivorans]